MHGHNSILMCSGKVKPNAFVSIRVPSPLIKEQLQACQDEMVRVYPSLRCSMVSLEKLHLTLMVLKLGSREDEEKCVHACNVTFLST